MRPTEKNHIFIVTGEAHALPISSYTVTVMRFILYHSIPRVVNLKHSKTSLTIDNDYYIIINRRLRRIMLYLQKSILIQLMIPIFLWVIELHLLIFVIVIIFRSIELK